MTSTHQSFAMRFLRFVAPFGTLVLAAPIVLAAQQPDSVRLQAVVITATRAPTPIAVTTQPVTVLRGADLRARGVMTVADALRDAPQISVARTGSEGGVTSFFMRGGESRYTKVLVDGVPVNTVGGTVFLQNLTLDNVDRIEIVGGPASALYGADAMTGVVQIFTRRGTQPGLDLALDGGTYGTRDASASLRTGISIADLSLGGGWHHTDGVLAFNNGYSNGTGSAALTLRPDAASTIALTSRYTDATYHFPTDYAGVIGDTTAYTREHRMLAGLDAARITTSWLTLRALGGYTEVHGNTDDAQNASSDRTHDVRATAEARAELRLPADTRVTLGVPYESEMEALRSAADYGSGPTVTSTHDERTTHGVYVAAQSEPARWLAYDASARYDTHSDYRSIATYHAGASLGLWPGARLRVAYGTGFNAPAFYETVGSAYNLPNHDLQPEQVHSIDIGGEQALLGNRVQLQVGAFDQRFSQIIQFANPPASAPMARGIYENLTRARSLGYTGSIGVDPVSGLAIGVSYSQTIARVTSAVAGGSASVGDALLRRPSHTANARASYAHAGWAGGVVVTYVGTRPDIDFQRNATVSLPAYTTVDLSAAAPVAHADGGSLALTARVANLFDRRYQEIAEFQAPGRTVLVGVRLSRD